MNAVVAAAIADVLICDALQHDDTTCKTGADVEVIVTYPCGASETRRVCAPHGRDIGDGWLWHKAHPEDTGDRAVVFSARALGGIR